MKICIINNLYPPYARGGAEQVVKRTVDGLLQVGHEVVLITSTPEGGWKETDDKLKIYRIKPKNIFFYTQAHERNVFMRLLWHFFDIFHFGSARYIERILKEEKPDVVHTHNLMGIGFLIPRVIRKLKIHHVHTVHDVQLVEPSGIILKTKEKSWRYNGLPTKIYTWIMKKLFASPEVVISPSQFLLDFYNERGFFEGSHKILVRNPLTLDFGKEKLETRNLKLGNTNNELNFLYLGQIEKHKGVFLLVDAFRHIQNAKLHIVGGGSQLDDLKNQADDNVQFYGRVDREKLPELFQKMDVTVVPSLCYENSPTVIFESLYFGVPVLASRIEGVVELIREGENGFTFEAGNAESLQEKLQWCVKNRDGITNMSTKIPTQDRPEGEYVEKLLNLYSSRL